jgi:hypothetical protein
LVLAGGLLAQGVRPIENREDYLYEQAAHYYWWMRTFPGMRGPSDVDALPPWLRQRLPDVHKIVKKLEEEDADRARKAADQGGR